MNNREVLTIVGAALAVAIGFALPVLLLTVSDLQCGPRDRFQITIGHAMLLAGCPR